MFDNVPWMDMCFVVHALGHDHMHVQVGLGLPILYIAMAMDDPLHGHVQLGRFHKGQCATVFTMACAVLLLQVLEPSAGCV
jgi:hypothetical protein